MAYTKAGAKAYSIAHQMQLQAASGTNPAHAEHIREFVDYANNLAEHYYQQATAYADNRINDAVAIAVEKALSDPKVELKVEEKSAQSAEKSLRSIFQSLFK